MYPTLQSRADILKMLDELSEHRQRIFDACDTLSELKLNDPVYSHTWSVLKNLSHLAWAEAYMLAWIKKRPAALPPEEFPPEPALDLKVLKVAFDEAHAAVIAFLKSHPEEVLKERCLYGKARSEQTVGGVLFHLIEHEIHHRGFILHKLVKLQKG
ncbi:MAG: DinB family protein [Gemmataceae bacterium]